MWGWDVDAAWGKGGLAGFGVGGISCCGICLYTMLGTLEQKKDSGDFVFFVAFGGAVASSGLMTW